MIKSDKNPSYFYDINDFPNLFFLEKEWETIKTEFENLIHYPNLKSWMETFPSYVSSQHKNSWQVFTFRFFGMNHKENQSICPKTTLFINQIQELISCDFSKMKGKTKILPHKGYSRMILRCHLPLVIPEKGKCGIRVGDEIRYHEEGKLMIFDDSFEHEAWNESDTDRTVLMFDIPNPKWHYSAEEISQYKIEHIEDPFLLNIASKETWLYALRNKELPI